MEKARSTVTNDQGEIIVEQLARVLDVQTDMGKEFIRQMLVNASLFDRKQRDYGSGNYLMFGQKGAIMRCNDKLMRLKKLVFDAPANSTLPVNELLRACVKAGHVALERDGDVWNLVYDADGMPMPAAQYDRLIRRRGSTRNERPTDSRILELCDEHARLKDAYRRGEVVNERLRQNEYVAKIIGYAPSTTADLIKDARKRAGLTKSKKKGK